MMVQRLLKRAALPLLLWPGWLSAAAAAPPVAIVEDVSGASTVGFMDYLYEGQALSLKPDQVLVLGYLQSCLHEIITGGTIVVGRERSAVTAGIVERRKVECDGNRLTLTAEEAATSGAMVYRDLPKPQIILYATSPAVIVPAPGMLHFQRIDKPAPAIDIEMTGTRADLGQQGVQLTPGAVYRATASGRTILFKVDSWAGGEAPILSRLLAF